MKRLAFLLIALTLAACATVGPPQLTGAQTVGRSKGGPTARQIIEELKRTNTVLFLSASDVVRLHEAGVPNEVLDFLQQQAYYEMRWRAYQDQQFWYGPFYRGYGWGPC